MHLLLNFPSKHETMVRYLEFMEFVKVPAVLIIAEYAMAAVNSIEPFDKALGFEWLENRIIAILQDQAEMEKLDYRPEDDILFIQRDPFPVGRYLSSLEHDGGRYQNLLGMIEDTNELFHYHYSSINFPETLEDYDPFFSWEVRLLNENTIIVEIIDNDDIEQFRDLFELDTPRRTSTFVLPSHPLPSCLQ